MENLKLSPATKTALQNFLQIWNQDPLAQQTLCIAPQNIFVCDLQDPNKITDITSELEEPNTDSNIILSNEHLESNTSETQAEPIPIIETSRNSGTWKSPRNIQELVEDLTQPLQPMESYPNPFLANTWQDQLEKISKRLQNNRKSKKGRIPILEAHYYLGKLLEENTIHQEQIQDQLEQKFGERRTRDLWISAQRQRKLFTACNKGRIYQSKLITVTKIVKLKESEFSTLVNSLDHTNL